MRSWTAQERAEFERYRRRYMTEVDDPASEPWETLTEEQKVAYLATLPKKIKNEEFKRLTTQAWNIGKRPIAKFVAPRGGTLQLPKATYGKTGYDTVKFRKGDELNNIVYNHYDTRVDPATYPGVNYVSSDGMLAKKPFPPHLTARFFFLEPFLLRLFAPLRHLLRPCMYSDRSVLPGPGSRREYLGPNPHVASYRFNKDKCDVEFWEAYLEKPWVRDTDWSVDAEFDSTVRWWFPASRSVF